MSSQLESDIVAVERVEEYMQVLLALFDSIYIYTCTLNYYLLVFI
jgi:hypothetical protein